MSTQQTHIEVPEEKLNRIYDKLQDFDERVSKLEAENSELRRENHHLKVQFESLKDEHEESIDEIETQLQVLESQAGHIADKNIELSETLENIQKSLSKHKEKTTERLAEIETSSESSGTNVTQKACELETISYIDSIEDKYSVDIRRAVVIWNNFEDWASRKPGGKTLKSGELRKLLSSEADVKLAWTQVYRAMDCFEQKTPDEYKIIDNNKTGKAIVKMF